MHIEVGLPQQSPKVLGIGNTSRCQNELATAAAKTFNGLPEGGSRWEALSVVKRLQRELSLTATQVSHLEFLVGYTRDQDWGSGSNPIVYLTVSATANLRGICERQVLNIEHALNRAGLVCWHDSGNQRRYGHRSANGELKQAFGVNLAPLAASYDRLLKMVHEQEHRAQIWKQEKATLLLLKRALREQLTLDPANGSSAQAMGLIKSLPRRVEARVPITQLVRWSQQIKDLLERFEQSAAAKDQQRGLGAPSVPHLGAESEASKDPQNTVGRKKTSGRSELDFRHINTNYTNQTLSNERRNKRALPHGNDLNSPLSANAQMALEKAKPESADRARQHLHGFEGRSDAPALPQTNPPSAQAAFLNSGIEHITLKQILACSSPMLREMISNASKAGGSDWTALIKAAKLAASFLGISTPAWQEACDKLGVSAAATIIVIAERRSTDPTTPINSYGGFVRGCLAKAETGNLHLHKSVFGLLAKGNLDE